MSVPKRDRKEVTPMKKTVATIVSLVILIIALFGVGLVTGRQEGDIACCVMHDQGTPNRVLDDVIVSVRYGGWMGEGVSEG